MGLGGHLTWTALASEVRKRTGKSCLPIETHGGFVKLVKSESFKNNPHILQEFPSDGSLYFPMVLNDPEANYCLKDTPTQAFHRSADHIIHTICKAHGIPNPHIKCELYLAAEEKIEALGILKENGIGKKFVCIEPHSKENYTPNRKYDLSKWQKVVDFLSSSIQVVQIGDETSAVLKNCISIAGKTSFRQVAAVISEAQLLLSSEGGLTHVSSAVNTKSIVILTGYQAKEMVCYRDHVYIDISSHGPCGMKIVCQRCVEDVKRHDPMEIIQACKKALTL